MSTNPEAGPRSHGSFSRRVAVIVGGGSGLRRAVAKGLARDLPEAKMFDGRWGHLDAKGVSR